MGVVEYCQNYRGAQSEGHVCQHHGRPMRTDTIAMLAIVISLLSIAINLVSLLR